MRRIDVDILPAHGALAAHSRRYVTHNGGPMVAAPLAR
jgi:hypothetical protein